MDRIPPEITCPEDLTERVTPASTNQFGAVVNWVQPTATDNVVGTPTVTLISDPTRRPGSLFPFGFYTIRYQASDASGNTAECTFTISVGKGKATKTFTQVDNEFTGLEFSSISFKSLE